MGTKQVQFNYSNTNMPVDRSKNETTIKAIKLPQIGFYPKIENIDVSNVEIETFIVSKFFKQ